MGEFYKIAKYKTNIHKINNIPLHCNEDNKQYTTTKALYLGINLTKAARDSQGENVKTLKHI